MKLFTFAHGDRANLHRCDKYSVIANNFGEARQFILKARCVDDANLHFIGTVDYGEVIVDLAD